MNKTTIISIPPCAVSNVLKSLHENSIDCKYVGIDQSGRILMELNFLQTQNELIRELITQMEKAEQVVNEFTKILNETMQKLQDEADKAWEEKIKVYKEKFKKHGKRSQSKMAEA